MAENSKIEWTDHTFNPWTGCTKVSPGCDHCYAESWAKRSGTVRWGAGEPRRRTTEANWRLPLKWNAQAEREERRFRVFCSSLADVFDNSVPPEWRRDLFALIQSTPHLDWLLLTKRIGNAKDMIFEARKALLAPGEPYWPPVLSNVWLGATVVNQEEADRDIPKLLAVPARVRFLSIEPMLGPIDLSKWLQLGRCGSMSLKGLRCGLPDGHDGYHSALIETSAPWLGVVGALHWVICGGESGPGARPMHPAWPRLVRNQCRTAGVPYLFKQWGEWAPAEAILGSERGLTERWMRRDGKRSDPEEVDFMGGDEVMYRAGKKAVTRLLDGTPHDGFPR